MKWNGAKLIKNFRVSVPVPTTSGCSTVSQNHTLDPTLSLFVLHFSAYIGHRLEGMYVINLGGHQLPDGRLNLGLGLRHLVAVNEGRPRRVHVLQVVEGCRQTGMMAQAVGGTELRHPIPSVLVQQLAQLALLRILDAQQSGPALRMLFHDLRICGQRIGRLKRFLGGGGREELLRAVAHRSGLLQLMVGGFDAWQIFCRQNWYRGFIENMYMYLSWEFVGT